MITAWKISPSIIAGDYLRMGEELREITEAGAEIEMSWPEAS